MLVDRNGVDRGYLDRGSAYGTPTRALFGYIISESTNYGRLTLNEVIGGQLISESTLYGSSIIDSVIRGYLDGESTGYGATKQDFVIAGYGEAETEGYLSTTFVLAVGGTTESEAEGFFRLMQDLHGFVVSESNLYGLIPNTRSARIVRLDRASLDRGTIYPTPVRELAGYIEVETENYGRLTNDIAIKGYSISESDETGMLNIGFLVSGHSDSESVGRGLITKYDYYLFTVSYPVEAGQTLVVDGEEYTVTVDGTNAISGFSGDWPRLIPGTNTITYSDTESGRTVLITISKKARQM